MNDEEIDLDSEPIPHEDPDSGSSSSGKGLLPTPSSSKSDDDSATRDGADGVPKMSEKEKKLFELRLRLNQCRKLNYKEVVEEDRKANLPGHVVKKLEKQQMQERRENHRKELEEQGEDPNKYYMYESAEKVDERNAKRKKKSSTDAHNDEALYNAYKKRVKDVPGVSAADYEKMKEEMGEEFYRDANSLTHGQVAKIPRQNLERMVSELHKTIEKREKFSRRRSFYDDADVDYINERNAVFNKKVERFYGKYTAEIKQNLERGTALP